MTHRTFFEHQEAARRSTSVLVFYFFVAVALIVLSIYSVVSIVFFSATESQGHFYQSPSFWDGERFLIVSMVTLLIIAVGTLYKVLVLSGGGVAVAMRLGGRPVSVATTDPYERRLLNVVEEMAIASGVPVPTVFILDGESGINAFAAGYRPGSAVIGATRGCLELLTREELQGVIAHEFSHILNGDMRLNIRLVGLLNGILVIGLTGYWMMRSVSRGGGRSRRDGRAIAAVMFLGLALYIIGYVGVFFGQLIQAAVSRQREFLADASAVQFTRMPDGISGALKKIGGLLSGSELETGRAREVSHMFFADGLRTRFLSLLATHPPLTERVKRIDPSFRGRYPVTNGEPVSLAGESAIGFQSGAAEVGSNTTIKMTPTDFTDSVGSPTTAHLSYAVGLLSQLPDQLRSLAQSPTGAKVLTYALLLDPRSSVAERQLELISRTIEGDVFNQLNKIYPIVIDLDPRFRLPLVDLSMPALREIGRVQYEALRKNVEILAQADNDLSLFEFALEQVLLRHLDPHYFGDRAATGSSSVSKEKIHSSAVKLLASLAYFGNHDTLSREAAFARALKTLNPQAQLTFNSTDRYSVAEAGKYLAMLASIPPKSKQLLLEACVTCTATDGQVTLEEAEFLRAIADALGCPVPPFLPQ